MKFIHARIRFLVVASTVLSARPRIETRSNDRDDRLVRIVMK